jgi:hypothetical protein
VFRGGAYVASAGKKLFTGAGTGGGPHVKIFTGTGQQSGPGFFAYDAAMDGGVTVAAGNLQGPPTSDPEIVTAPVVGGPHVKVFNLLGGTPFGVGFYAYEPNFTGGVEVSVGEVKLTQA